MFKKLLYSFVLILFLFSFNSLIYGADVTVSVTKVRFVYQDGSSEIKELSEPVEITFYGNDTTYGRVYLGNFTNLAGRVITSINFYIGTGWLGEGAISTADINDPNIYNALGSNTVDVGQYSTVTAKCYYDGRGWQPATPGPDPTPSPEPTPDHTPSIKQLTASPSSITYPETSKISFSVSDPDGDDVSWSASISGGSGKGSLSSSSGKVSGGSGNVSITYTPENTDASFTIHVYLDDGNGNTTSGSVGITVISVNNSPQISNLSASPNPITAPHPNSESDITFDVSDLDGDDISWTAAVTSGPSPQGDITPPNGTVHGGSGSVSTVYKPKKKTPNDTFTITVELTDGNGGTATDSIDIILDR